MTDKKNRVSDAIVKLRRSYDATQEEFAKILSVGRVTLAGWETSRTPGAEKLFHLAMLARTRSLYEVEDVFTAELMKIAPSMRVATVAAIRIHAEKVRKALVAMRPAISTEIIGILEEIDRLAKMLAPETADATPDQLSASSEAGKSYDKLTAVFQRADANRRTLHRLRKKGL